MSGQLLRFLLTSCKCMSDWGCTSTDSSASVFADSLDLSFTEGVCARVSVCFMIISVCVLFHRLVLTSAVCRYLWVCVCIVFKKCLLFLKVGFDPHPHMRVPGMPPSLTGIPGGKP